MKKLHLHNCNLNIQTDQQQVTKTIHSLTEWTLQKQHSEEISSNTIIYCYENRKLWLKLKLQSNRSASARSPHHKVHMYCTVPTWFFLYQLKFYDSNQTTYDSSQVKGYHYKIYEQINHNNSWNNPSKNIQYDVM